MNRVYKWYLRMHNSKCKLFRRFIEVILRIVFSCDIPPEVKIGDNCRFAHNALGVVLHPKVVIGNNVIIGQNVTIGGRSGFEAVPVIGNDVLIGANALVLGPITIGDGSRIGAGAIVVKDVPDNATVLASIGKIIEKDESK